MRTRRGAAAPWFIALAAAGCGIWAVVDFLGAARPDAPAVVAMDAPAARSAGDPPVELYRLLADGDCLDDVGTLVTVDGTVADAAGGSGFWLSDLRDNVVWIDSGARPRAGDVVRVVGRLERMAAGAPPTRAPANAGTIVHDVRVAAAGPAAVEVLRD